MILCWKHMLRWQWWWSRCCSSPSIVDSISCGHYFLNVCSDRDDFHHNDDNYICYTIWHMSSSKFKYKYSFERLAKSAYHITHVDTVLLLQKENFIFLPWLPPRSRDLEIWSKIWFYSEIMFRLGINFEFQMNDRVLYAGGATTRVDAAAASRGRRLTLSGVAPLAALLPLLLLP